MKRYLLTLFAFLLVGGLMAQQDVYQPTLKAPENNAVNQVPNVTISWNAIAGSLGLQYQVQVDTTLNFNSALKVDTTLLLLTGYTNHELLFGQQYYWRVRAIDQGQTSVWSEIWNFQVFNSVTLGKPANNSKGKAPNVYLNWKATVPGSTSVVISGVTNYNYQMDVTTDFNSPQLWQGSVVAPVNPKTTDTIYVRTSQLYFGVKYYWRVRAYHHLDSSAWCDPYNFTVAARDTMVLPENGKGGYALDTKLKWRGFSGGLIAYEYELAKDAGFNQIIAHSEVDTNFAFATLTTFNTKYYVRARGRHQKDTLDWSFPFNFTTIKSVLLYSPDSAALDVSSKPKLGWKAMTGVTGYQIQLDSLINFPNPILDFKPSATDVSYTMTKKLNPLKTYYWRMRAFSVFSGVADTSDWSIVWPFTTASAIGMDEPGYGSFSIYPNPAKDKITLRVDMNEAGQADFVLVDLLGKALITRELSLSNGTNTREIQLENVNKGIYIVRLTINGQTINRKVIVD